MAGNVFNLELGDNFIRVADSQPEGKSIAVNALGAQENTPNFFNTESEKISQDEGLVIEKTVNALNIKKKNVNIIIPDAYTYSQILEMPALKEKELLAAIKYQADQFIPLPLDETTIDLNILYEDKVNKKILLLIVAASQNLINRVIGTVERAGLIPQSVENEISAFSRFVSTLYNASQNPGGVIFVNLGFYTTSLYYFDTKLRLVTNHHNFRLGYNLFFREIQVNFDLNEEKTREILNSIGLEKEASYNLENVLKPVTSEFSREIEKFIIALKEKNKDTAVSNIVFFNLTSKIHSLEKKIQENINIPASIFDGTPYFKKNQIIDALNKDLSSFVTVVSGSLI
jgi:type IV pilus assembly protein PilM